MFKRVIVPVLGFAVLFGTLGAGAARAELKIGYIRSDYIFSKYEPYQQAQKQLDALQKEQFDQLEKMRTEIEKDAKDADSKTMLMTDEAKRSKYEELNKRQQDLQARYEELVSDDGILMKKQQELLQPIIDRINEVIMRLARADAYDYIFDATVSAGSPILFAADKYDLSDRILEELKKGGSASGSTAK